MMVESGPIRLVRPSAVIITHQNVKRGVGQNFLLNRVTFIMHLAPTIFKNSEKAVYRALFFDWELEYT